MIFLGITPTGNIFIDKYKLNKFKQSQNNEQEFNLADLATVQEENPEQAKLEESRIGATQLGELKKILLGL